MSAEKKPREIHFARLIVCAHFFPHKNVMKLVAGKSSLQFWLKPFRGGSKCQNFSITYRGQYPAKNTVFLITKKKNNNNNKDVLR